MMRRFVTSLFAALGLAAPVYRRHASGDIVAGARTTRSSSTAWSARHPYYWAGFAVIGDAARPLVRVDATASATASAAAIGPSVQAAGSR